MAANTRALVLGRQLRVGQELGWVLERLTWNALGRAVAMLGDVDAIKTGVSIPAKTPVLIQCKV